MGQGGQRGAEEGEEEDSETGKKREEKERASVWDRKASLGQCNEAHWNEKLQVTNQDMLRNMGPLVLSMSWK